MSSAKTDQTSDLLPHYGICLATYRGEGCLVLEGGATLRCQFETGQLADGTVVLLCDLPPAQPAFLAVALGVPVNQFEGTTAQRACLSAEGIRRTNYLPERPADRPPDEVWTAAFDLNTLRVELVKAAG